MLLNNGEQLPRYKVSQTETELKSPAFALVDSL